MIPTNNMTREQRAEVEGMRFAMKCARERISTLEQENARLREALEKIEEGRGPFSTDQLRFATDTIESMKSIARAALSGVPKEGT